VAPLSIPLAAIIGCFVVKALKVMRSHPVPPDLTEEDRARLSRITEMIDRMESRITALETLLKEDQASKDTTHEKTF
jgi:phage shock protein B